MTDVSNPARAEIERLDPESVAAWLEGQRWYASKSRHVTGLERDRGVSDAGGRATRPPLVTLVQARFASGSHELYQLPLALFEGPGAGRRPHAGIDRQRGQDWACVDAVADPELVRELLRQIDAESVASTPSESGCISASSARNRAPPASPPL